MAASKKPSKDSEENVVEQPEGIEDTPLEPEIDILDPQFSILTLSTGTTVKVERLKMRQLMKLMRILTSAGHIGALFSVDPEDNDAFATHLIAVAVASIPEAEDETVDFIRSLVTPADLHERPASKYQREENDEKIEALAYELQNPEIDDFIDIIEKVIRKEAPHLESLGNRLASLLPKN